MAHFAQIDKDNVVVQVIVVDNNELLDNGIEVEQKGIDFCRSIFGGNWIQTSYNGKFRGRLAAVGFTYDSQINEFVPPPENFVMNFYIQVENGQTINSPEFDKKLTNVFGCIPPEWEPFVFSSQPFLHPYQILVSQTPTNQKVNGIWTNFWDVREMTPEEKLAKQEKVKLTWLSRPQAENWSAWTFDDATCQYVPPIPRPERDQIKLDSGIATFWCGAENNWKDTPPRPQDGKRYNFDFFAWSWVEIPAPQAAT